MSSKINTYYKIIDILFKTESIENDSYSTTFKDGKYTRSKNGGRNTRPPQEIIVTDSELLYKCTNSQRYIIGIICRDLKQYNALWYCDPELKKNSANREAIKRLIEMEVLIKTETTNIYLVNPLFIRRGDFHGVLAATAKTIMNDPIVSIDHIVDKRPVKEITFVVARGNSEGYGYPTGEVI